MQQFDVALFEALNDEYAEKPLVPAPRPLTGVGLAEQGRRRLVGIEKHLSLYGKRVLEIGCGRGHTSRVLVDDYGCDVVAVDIRAHDDWNKLADLGLTFHRRDLTEAENSDLGKFDVVLSFVVLEHVLHPYGMLKAIEPLLASGGKTYLSANLYRGPRASHRYREVFFPWPHLLFTDEVFAQFYQRRDGNRATPKTAAWVNKMTAAQYRTYFDLIGFAQHNVWLSAPLFDEDLYHRFHDLLGRYPRFDLSHDFIYAVLGPSSDREESESTLGMQARLMEAEARLARTKRELAEVRARMSVMAEAKNEAGTLRP